MKILVYGCGVIGAYLVHKLCEAGNDVTVAARGRWKRVLAEKGLRIHHKLSGKCTLDQLKVAENIPETQYFDIVFSVMQGQQQKSLIPTLARVNTPLVILVGNNLCPTQMEEELLSLSPNRKKVLFGFQGTAGVRDANSVTCVSLGGSMTIGGLHQEPDAATKQKLTIAFGDTGYQLHWMDDMEGWLYCHAAFILPMVYLSYRRNCDLKKADQSDIDELILAVEEGYKLLEYSGISIRPEEDEVFFDSDAKKAAIKKLLFILSKTSLGKLCVTDHCRNAVSEMEWLDEQFELLRQKAPDFYMPTWNKLRNSMPDWEQIHLTYDREKGTLPVSEADPNYRMPKEIMFGSALGTGALLTAGSIAMRKAEKKNSKIGKLFGTVFLAGAVGCGIYSIYIAITSKASSRDL